MKQETYAAQAVSKSNIENLLNSPVRIVGYRPELQRFFENLNRAWIERYFKMEAVDFEILQHPQTNIIDKGGAVLFAELNGQIVGTVALKYYDPETLELAKMAVDENYQGHGIGEKLGRAAIEKARELGAKKLILFTNSSLQPALRLYARLGFEKVPLEGQIFKRSDTKMEIDF